MGIFDEEDCIECVNATTGETVAVPFFCKMPSWDSVHASYRKQVSTQDPIAMESASATRVATAILEGMQQCFSSTTICKSKFRKDGSFANVKELKEWLSEKDVWGTATVDGEIFDCESQSKEIMEKICGHNGVIIIERKNNINYATLWENYKTIDGDIKNGDTIYFWQLYDNILNNNFKTMDLAAVGGFEIINEMSKYWNVEIGLSIYTLDNQRDKFYLGGLKIGNYETVGIGNTPRDLVAFIHTHVAKIVGDPGNRDNSYFFSSTDFLTAYIRNIYTYMKHINDSMIFMAKLPTQSNELDTQLRTIPLYGCLADCHQRENCYYLRRESGDNICREANEELQVRRRIGKEPPNLKNIINHSPDFKITPGNCVFGVFIKNEELNVFQIDVNGNSKKI